MEKSLGGEPALSLLHLVAVSIPVKQVGSGGTAGEVERVGGSGVRVGQFLRFLLVLVHLVVLIDEVLSLHNSLVSGPKGTYIIYHD